MGRYSIKNLEELSGIKAHTIRAWENRYGIIQPKRTSTNIRYYDDNDLKLVLNISLLNNYGYKISEIASMPKAQILEAVNMVTEKTFEHQAQMNMLTVSMIELDENKFEKIVSNCILRYGLEYSIINIIFPFLGKVGIMWQTDTINPCHEHFVSSLIRQKIIVAIDGQNHVFQDNAESYLLFLPEGENHEIGLLVAHYILKSRGKKVFYLGSNVPFEELKIVWDTIKPDYMLTMAITSPVGKELIEYMHKLAKTFHKSTILGSGYQILLQQEEAKNLAVILKDVRALINYLDKEPAKKA